MRKTGSIATRYSKKLFRESRNALKILTNGLLLSTLPSDATLRLLAQFLLDTGNKNFDKEFASIYRRTKVRSAIGLSIQSLDSANRIPTFIASQAQLLGMYRAQFDFHREMLISFEAHRMAFERDILRGDFDNAQAQLKEIHALSGESYWLARNTILLLGLQGHSEEMGRFCEAKKEESSDPFLSILLSWTMLLTTDPNQHLRIVRNSITELTEAGIPELADLISLLFIPTTASGPEVRLNCLSQIQNFPIIDRFVLAQKLASGTNASEIVGDSELRSTINEVRSAALASTWISDEEHLIRRIMTLYETGAYDTAANAIEAEFQEIRSPIALVPILGKIDAMLGRAHQNSESTIATLRNAAASLFKLERNSKQSENEFSAKAILHHLFSDADQIPAALSIVTPHAFTSLERQRLAQGVLASQMTVTPVIHANARCRDPILGYDYLSSNTEIPAHRALKCQIRELCKGDNFDSSMIESLLDEFCKEAPLERDYFELASSALLTLGSLEKLLAICASGLTKHPSAVSAFPMSTLISFIESGGISTIDAVIVSHFYATNIDPEKTYVLNETYEEYLYSRGYRRPSEMPLDPNDPKLTLFFRDISNLTTMDFLGSFKSSNDLRAERISILDKLRDEHLISPEAHRLEVDEIVGKVIVDSGATEFNISKISADIEAIKRKVIDDVTALFGLFKSFKDDSTDAFLSVQSDPQRSTAISVVAGDKNTTLLKILSRIREVFLFDERLGLDRNLSAEIRHGFFSNLMRSRLEAHHLITELNSEGEYEANNYWREINTFISEEGFRHIDAQLAWFSGEFNKLIATAETWMKVATELGDKDRVFTFPVYKNLFERLKSLSNEQIDAEQLIDVVLEYHVHELSLKLAAMREKLNTDLTRSVDKLFDELIQRINNVRGDVALVELLATIKQVKNDIREDVATAAGWFDWATDIDSSSKDVETLINVAAECFGRVRPAPIRLTKRIDAGLKSTYLDGKSVKPFLLALINLFENCTRHSGYGITTDVELLASGTKEKWNIVITNPVTEAKYEALLEGKFSRAQRNTAATAAREAIHVEGGSGLGKIVNQLGAISEAFSLSVNLAHQSFEAGISYDPSTAG